jgi:DNA-binding NtrC family response regulator
VTQIDDKVRILAVVSSDTENLIQLQIHSLNISNVFVSNVEQLANSVRNDEVYQVAMLPAALPEGMDWWTVWGELALLTHRPAILVYAHTANFQLWSGVLDAGGYDVVVEPFTRERLKEAVLRAATSFEIQRKSGDATNSPDQ